MSRFRRPAPAIGIAARLILALALALPLPALAQDIVIDPAEGITIELDRPADKVFLAEPEIADVAIAATDRIFLFGKKPGRTSLFALDANGDAILANRVIVQPSLDDLRDVLEAELGVRTVKVVYNKSGVILSGTIPTPAQRESASEIAAQFLGEGAVVLNRLKVTGKTQVHLRVRIAEISRNVTRELGINWSAMGSVGDAMIGIATGRDIAGRARAASGAAAFSAGLSGSSGSIEAVVDALAANGLVSILAEPNLTARSGETANFLAGGEFPVPVSRGENGVTTEFRRFGVSLAFTPQVLSEDLITIAVRPEVSELTNQGSVTVDGFSIPGISTRQVETTVDLSSGQSFAIGGLIRNTRTANVRNVPGLARLPVLGPLFRSTDFQRNETELIVIVTPYIVKPAANPNALPVPTDTVVGDVFSVVPRMRPLPEEARAAARAHDMIRLRGGYNFIIE